MRSYLLLLALFPAQEPAPTASKPAPPPARSHYLGREIAPTMSHQGGEWLLRPEREQEESCTRLLEALRLQADQVVADIGCGNGFYTLKLAEKVGPGGKVFGVEIQTEYFAELESRARAAGLEGRIQTQEGSLVDPGLPPGCLDLVLLVDVYHEFSHPERMLRALRKTLKDDGALVLVEFRLEDPDVPILKLHKMSKAQILREVLPNGYRLLREYDELPWQHVMFFGRGPEPPEQSLDP